MCTVATTSPLMHMRIDAMKVAVFLLTALVSMETVETPLIGANCTDMVGTLMIRRLLSPVPPDGSFH